MPIPQRSYGEIGRDLEDFDTFIASLGLPRGRLRRVIENLRQVEAARVAGALASLNSDPKLAELVWSVVEGQEFAEIYRTIRDYDALIAKPLIQKAMKGPAHPLAEDSGRSNVGRNTVFELRLGALFKRAGAAVTLGQSADLLVDHSEIHAYVECKRPFSENGIRQNITKARNQLRNRFTGDSHPLPVGLVAISVSKALNAGSNMYIVDDEQALKGLSTEACRVHELYGKDFDQLVDTRLVGVIYHVFTPAFVRSAGLLVGASQFDVFLHTPSLQAIYPISAGEPLKKLLRAL